MCMHTDAYIERERERERETYMYWSRGQCLMRTKRWRWVARYSIRLYKPIVLCKGSRRAAARPTTAPTAQEPVEFGADCLPFIVPPCDCPCTCIYMYMYIYTYTQITLYRERAAAQNWVSGGDQGGSVWWGRSVGDEWSVAQSGYIYIYR